MGYIRLKKKEEELTLMRNKYHQGILLLCAMLLCSQLVGCSNKNDAKKADQNNTKQEVNTESIADTEEEDITTEFPAAATLPAEESSEAAYLSGSTKSSMDALETDYNKVNWGVSYTPFKKMKNIVFSVAPYYDGFSWYLIVGITNLYDQDISIYGEGMAKNADGEDVGSTALYETCIGSGNTVIETIFCTDEPDGRISWKNLKADTAEEIYVPWEADWSLQGNSPGFSYSYSLYSTDDTKEMIPYSATALFLDSDGNIIATGEDYSTDTITKDYTHQSSLSVYVSKDGFEVKDVALFVNPVEVKAK